MLVSCEAFWLQKAGVEPEEFEDAYFPKEPTRTECERFRCAVADGATETSFAALWAQLLVESYVRGELDLAPLQETWGKHVSGLKLPWYAEEKARSGAFAAIVGLSLSQPQPETDSGTWECRALGDSCLFQTRSDELIKSVPLENWTQFGSSPLLLSSNPDRNKGVIEKITTSSGTWHYGDVFYMMSDAISCWFLRRQEEHKDAVTCIAGITDQDTLAALVSEQRALTDSEGSPLMRNDDVTLLRVRPMR